MTAEMTYSESAKGVKITRDRAIAELRDHGITDAESVKEGLDYAIAAEGTYSASRLLSWLGY